MTPRATDKYYANCEQTTRQQAMPTEDCGVCGTRVPFSDTVHVLVHTRTDEGVVDYYVCRSCYEGELAPVFE